MSGGGYDNNQNYNMDQGYNNQAYQGYDQQKMYEGEEGNIFGLKPY